jgi:hypothetical protein
VAAGARPPYLSLAAKPFHALRRVKRIVSNSELPFIVPFEIGLGEIPLTPPPKEKTIVYGID